ncbi:MAG: hypothetical protein SWK90_06225 [Chloroflexota bacterium]|nr:hypothetical protein [Chloroflexota bacterium]
MREILSLNGTWHYETTDGQTGEMTIPSNWHLAGLPDYAGTVTFRRTFRLDALPDVETLRDVFTPDELWPPDWDKWARRDFQYDQTFNIAGVEMGEHRGIRDQLTDLPGPPAAVRHRTLPGSQVRTGDRAVPVHVRRVLAQHHPLDNCKSSGVTFSCSKTVSVNETS